MGRRAGFGVGAGKAAVEAEFGGGAGVASEMKKVSLFYLLTLLICVAGVWLVLQEGKRLESRRAAVGQASAGADSAAAFVGTRPAKVDAGLAQTLNDNLKSPLGRLLIQLIVVVFVARSFGALATRLGQPAVIGEMIAGIVLGPSVVGSLFPGASQFLFPAASLGNLRLLSQIGVVLFMFVVGMEMDVGHLRNRAQTALVVSHAGIVAPFLLGVVVALALYRETASSKVPFLPFALFIGVAMSITAFPVLARIISERQLTKTFLGGTALTCAAVNDVAAWSILAFVVAVAQAGSLTGSALTLLLVAAFAAVMLAVAKPLLSRLPVAWLEPRQGGKGLIAAALIFLLLCALFTELIGIHALFGAFLAGVVMPDKASVREHLIERLESFSTVFLLPIFFAFTGLRTQIGLLDGWSSWGLCLLVTGTATLGKLGGSLLAARWTGMNWSGAFCLGALMNTRGLVELIVLNIGYDMGILSPTVFAMMVVMALVTTCMTGPLLSLGQSWGLERPALKPVTT